MTKTQKIKKTYVYHSSVQSLAIDKQAYKLLPYSKPMGFEVKPEVILPLDSVDDDDFK